MLGRSAPPCCKPCFSRRMEDTLSVHQCDYLETATDFPEGARWYRGSTNPPEGATELEAEAD